MAVLTNAGGPGVTAADAIEANGLKLANLSADTHQALRASLPAAASLHNPVDMLASATPEQYAVCLEVLLSDPSIHGVMVILPPPPMHTAGAVAKAIIPIIHQTDKPVVIALMGEKLIQEAVEHFRAARVPEYRFPERAASALAILVERAEFLKREQEPPLNRYDVDREAVAAILSTKATVAFEIAELCSILTAYGIATPPVELAKTSQEAVQIAERFGYPIALKVASPDIPHKSDVGGVLLNLKKAQAISRGFATIIHNARLARPQANIRGVHVQHMLDSGQEVIIGAIQDPQFGPLVMFGSGGVEVERLGDVAFALAPITREEADDMLDNTLAGQRLKGYRSLAPADRQAVIEILMRVAQLAADFPQIAEIEINPLRVLLEGEGAFAVDVRGRLITD